MHPTHQRLKSGLRPIEPTPATAEPKTRRASRRNPARSRRKPGTGASGDTDTPSASLYDAVTSRIIGELEAGHVPWVQPWSANVAAAHPSGSAITPGLPRNALTGRSYSGVNILTLWAAIMEHGHPSQSWLTFKQALAAGGCVRKGERGITVFYADRFTPNAEKVRATEIGRDAKTIAFLKRFTVFNVAQCDGLRPGLAADPAPRDTREIIPIAETLIAAAGVDFRIGGTRAFYVPDQDFVAVPPQPAFFDQINYYRTCLHELTHATGHPSRLARTLTTDFGSKNYAREELVAEMGSAFLCAALGLVPTVRHADYLASWLEVLREDNRAIFRAASAASKAADWLLARLGEGESNQSAARLQPGCETETPHGPPTAPGAEARP